MIKYGCLLPSKNRQQKHYLKIWLFFCWPVFSISIKVLWSAVRSWTNMLFKDLHVYFQYEKISYPIQDMTKKAWCLSCPLFGTGLSCAGLDLFFWSKYLPSGVPRDITLHNGDHWLCHNWTTMLIQTHPLWSTCLPWCVLKYSIFSRSCHTTLLLPFYLPGIWLIISFNTQCANVNLGEMLCMHLHIWLSQMQIQINKKNKGPRLFFGGTYFHKCALFLTLIINIHNVCQNGVLWY